MSEIRMKFFGRTQMPFGEEILKWELVTDAHEEEVWEFCKREICSNRPVKTKDEWEEGQKGDSMDVADYAKGYARLVRVSNTRWWFEKHLPNMD